MEQSRSRVWVIVILLAMIFATVCFFGFRMSDKRDTNRNVGIQPSSDGTVTLSGSLKLNDNLVLMPGAEPTAPVAGHMYYDQTSNVLNYYNGTKFVALSGGIASLVSSSEGLVVADDGSGNLTLALSETESEPASTPAPASGDSISLPLGVVDGGTGKTSLSSNGVLVGNGTSSLYGVTAASAGLCLLSTAGAPEFDTCPVGSSGDEFVQGGNSFGALAVLGTTDNFGLSLRTNNAEVTAFSNTGQASFQNTSNSTTGFRVLNAASVAQFVVDTTNSRVYVGNPAADTTGALLVLDTKTDTGDPTGVAGAMYYNSSIPQFRCYEANYWRDCVQSIRTSYHYSNDMIGTGADSSIDWVTNNGAFGGSSGEPSHPGIVTFNSSTGDSGTYNWIVPRSPGTQVIRLGNGTVWRHESVLQIPSSPGLSTPSERFSYRTGFIDDATANSGNGVDGCYFKYSDNINSARWQGVCRNNSTESTCDTGATVAADTWYRLTVVVNAAGSSADFQINGTSMCQVASDIPTSSGRETNWGTAMYKDVGTTNRLVRLDYIDVEGQFGSAR